MCARFLCFFFFFLNNPAPPEISPLPLPAALPISPHRERVRPRDEPLARAVVAPQARSGEVEGGRGGADRGERDPPLLRPRALGDAAAGALGPGGALRRARGHALLAGRPPPGSPRPQIVPTSSERRPVRWPPRRAPRSCSPE